MLSHVLGVGMDVWSKGFCGVGQIVEIVRRLNMMAANMIGGL